MSAENPVRAAVLGAGSFGTCLSILLAERGFAVDLWARDTHIASAIEKHRRNPRYLTDFVLPKNVHATASLGDALADKELVISVVPSHAVREVWEPAHRLLRHDALVVSASKGIEVGTGKLCSDVLMEVLPARMHERLCFLSGPSFAREIAERRPTAVALAARNETYAVAAQSLISSPLFRCYTNSDVIGVELGGALKNVIAIAVGVADGMESGLNSRAALITRGLAEMTRLGVAMGANPVTFLGLSGVGDLVLTCTGDLSRNRQVGLEIGRGRPVPAVLAGLTQVAEGVRTAKSAYELAQKLGVDMPITSGVYLSLYEGKNPFEAASELRSRQLKSEME
ncbi:MAG TPA: NAD(P)H-dependent glycerol-3-phosphate dehydrogenase [Myxococcota bacterium]|nr:NAD(P)H-dependent glycerol-3-phosphate dehydrogenase [Myxococcota bacterium]